VGFKLVLHKKSGAQILTKCLSQFVYCFVLEVETGSEKFTATL